MSDRETLLCPAGFPVPAGTSEWELIPGPKGDQGERGEKGASRLPFRLAWALVVLFVLAVAIGGSALFLSSREIAQNNQKWCQTIDTLLIQRPPSGPAVSNPSRAYEQKLYADFHTLRGQLGCG